MAFGADPSTSPPSHIHNTRVDTLEQIGLDVVRLVLRTEGNTTMTYQAGQYIAIHLPGGETRCYSMARAWQPDGLLELHIRLHPGGLFSAWLFNALQSTEPHHLSLTISGPYGDCIWRQPIHRQETIVMLATGTGIAPLAALLEQALATNETSTVTLYWGGRSSDELYLSRHFEELAQQHPNFCYVPVLASPEATWVGWKGFVQECAAENHPDLRTARVYACGSPVMVSAARQLLTEQCGLDAEHFHADAFEPSVQSCVTQTGNLIQVRVRQDAPQPYSLSLAVVAKGTLLAVLRQAHLLSGICGGNASCGTCRIDVRPDWSSRLPSPNRTEARLLAALNGSHPHHRLACQIQLNEALDGLCLALPQNTP